MSVSSNLRLVDDSRSQGAECRDSLDASDVEVCEEVPSEAASDVGDRGGSSLSLASAAHTPRIYLLQAER